MQHNIDTITSADLIITNKDNDKIGISYSNIDRKIIQTRIEQITNKRIHLKIFKIIRDNSQNYMTNDNGTFFNLSNISDISLFQIEQLLNAYDLAKQTKEIDPSWSKILNHQISSNSNNYNKIDDKLSNQEKLFLKVAQQQDTNTNITFWNP